MRGGWEARMPSGGSLGPLPQPTDRGHQPWMAPLPGGLGKEAS